jgi:hypothetical protein
MCIMDKWINPHSYPDEGAGLHKDAREYWNERCAITVAWEEANGIKMKQKKKKSL